MNQQTLRNATVESSPDTPGNGETSAGPIRILHLEDSILDADLILETLNEGGVACESIRVDTRQDYLALLERDRFDLILADYSLPSFDGITALGLAREVQPDVPFILISGVLGEETAIDTLKSGATDYVLKQRLSRIVLSVQRALQEAEDRKQRKLAQEALRKNEALLRSLIEGTTDAVFVKDLDGRYMMINAAGARSIGKSLHEIIGRTDLELMAVDNAEIVMADDREIAESGETRTFEEGVRSWGTTRTYLSTKGPIRDVTGEIMGVFGISRDITARKREEEKLREAESKYRSIVEQLPVVTYIGSPEDTVTTLYVSPQLESMLGLLQDDLDDPECWSKHIHPEDKARVLADYRITQQTGETTSTEYRFICGTGDVLWFRDHRMMVRDVQGDPQFVQGVMLFLSDCVES